MSSNGGQDPVVTIVLPTHSRPYSLPRAIESAIAQSLTAWEMIVIDDASTDATAEILREFAAKDARIRVVRNEKSQFKEFGIAHLLNRGIELARGKYIARLDDDDYWIDPDKLKMQVEYLDAHPKCVIVGSGVIVIDAEGKERFRYLKKTTDAEIRRSALSANPFSHTTVMFRKDVAQAVGAYQARHIEDWDLWLRMGLKGEFYNLPKYLTAYTMTDDNASFKNQRELSRLILGLVVRNRGKYPGFVRGYVLNFAQYLFACLPMGVRSSLHASLVKIKRKAL